MMGSPGQYEGILRAKRAFRDLLYPSYACIVSIIVPYRSGAAVRLLPGSCPVPPSCPVPARRPVPARFLPDGRAGTASVGRFLRRSRAATAAPLLGYLILSAGVRTLPSTPNFTPSGRFGRGTGAVHAEAELHVTCCSRLR